jgi:hypothetical protein
MDLLLIFLSIAGVVFAGVMLLLAARTKRMERESDARVDELVARATGTVLFAADPSEPPMIRAIEPIEQIANVRQGAREPWVSETSPVSQASPLSPVTMVDEAPLRLREEPADTGAAWDEFIDEASVEAPPRDWTTQPAAAVPAHPFVIDMPATAGAGRVFSFARSERRSRT